MRARAASVSAGSTVSCAPLMPMANEVRFSTAAGLSTELLVFAELAIPSDTEADSTVLGLSIEAIRQLLTEEDPGSVIALLLDEQEAALKKEIGEREEMLKKLAELRSGLKSVDGFSLESIGDIAYTMKNRKELKKTRMILLLTGLPLAVLQWASVILWIVRGIWQLFPVWAVLAVLYGVIMSRWYFRKTAYICPGCHTVFQPAFREAFFANHTPAARKLTCTACGRRGFCVEVAAGSEVSENA